MGTVSDPPDGSRPPNEDTLEQLLTRARAGSSEALGQLLQACRHYLLLAANEE
jgi:hypothetical protein